MIFIGLDPGQSGGIAAIDGYEHVVRAWAMPDSERGVWELVSNLARMQGEKRAALEAVNAFPGQGVSSCFTFGRGYGFLRACLYAAGIPFEDVRPLAWQKALGCTNGSKLAKAAHKRKLKALAEAFFPSVDVTLKTADALLVAEWLRRRECGSVCVSSFSGGSA